MCVRMCVSVCMCMCVCVSVFGCYWGDWSIEVLRELEVSIRPSLICFFFFFIRIQRGLFGLLQSFLPFLIYSPSLL